MIKYSIVDIKGGLGNQIFQIAYAMHLRKLGHKVFTDVRFFDLENQFPRSLEINPEEFGFTNIKFKNNKIFLKLNTFFYEDFSFSTKNFKWANRFVGYYQNVQYLDSCKDEFRKILKIDQDTTNKNTIAVHIRKTDYSTIQQELSKNYYTKALNLFEDHSLIDIFTDENHLPFKDLFSKKNINNIYTNNNKTKPVEALQKLSTYSNYIIANSSFSLIASILSAKSNKKVIYPSPWFRKSDIHIVNIPTDWISIFND